MVLRANTTEILAQNVEQSWRKVRFDYHCCSCMSSQVIVQTMCFALQGAFEIIDEDTGELLYSKLKIGKYVSPKGDGSRDPAEEASATAAMEVLLDEIEDLVEDATEAASNS
eukprot:SAG31_NODE_2_length_46263_cov_45.908043_7_plen_112_part_00